MSDLAADDGDPDRHLQRRRLMLDLAVGMLAGLLGAVLGMAIAGPATSRVGPLTVSTTISPAWTGRTQLHLLPLGEVNLPTHSTPVVVDATVTGVDLTAATTMLRTFQGPGDQATAVQSALTEQARGAVRKAALRSVLAAAAGALALAALLTRRRRPVVVAVSTVAVVAVGLAVGTRITWNSAAIREPSFTGELTSAPQVIGDLASIPDNLDRYGTELAGLVGNVTKLSRTLTTLPDESQATGGTVPVLHISDIHLAVQAWPTVAQIVRQYHVAFVVDTGDLADHGTPTENQALAPIGRLPVPYVYVKGNHDSASTVAAVAGMPNATVLDDSLTTIAGITVAGAGDPRVTPDKLTRDDGPQGAAEVVTAAQTLAGYVRAHPGTDLVAFHDPHGFAELDGTAPTLLFGHLHQQYTWRSDQGSRVFVQGSTGGAGLRALQGETPTPVTLTVLYVVPGTGEVKAFDDITLGGLGTTSAQVTRHTIRPDGTTSVDAVPPDILVPTPSPTAS